MPKVAHECTECSNTFMEWAYRNYKRCPDCRIVKPPFTIEQIDLLYWDRGMTTRQIAKKLDITRRRVEYWMRKLGIDARSPIETRYPDRPKPPTREVLYNLYWVRYMSYAEIAEKYKVDATAVPYWLRKFDIQRRSVWDTRRRGDNPEEPTEEELNNLYWKQKLSLDEISIIYNMSAHAIQLRMKKFDLPLRAPGYNQIRYTADDGHEVYSGLELLVDNWLYSHNLEHIYEPLLPFGGMADFLVSNNYIEVWGIVGNKKYDERIKEKKTLYKKHGLKLIGLRHDDIHNNLDKKLKCLLV